MPKIGSTETLSVAWGDYDGDGDLDLAVGNYGQPNRLYRNDGGMLTTSAVWSSVEADNTFSEAWGDYDSDGDLDLAVGNNCYSDPNCRSVRLYRNDGGTLTTSAIWSSVEAGNSETVAWGDYDSDGDLDLAVGNSGYEPVWLYRNDSGTLTSSAIWSSIEVGDFVSIAWGDVDGDGDLDLAVGNGDGVSPGQPNRLYRNDSGTLTTDASAAWSSVETDATYSMAWGDYDGDGDLDLAVGNADHYDPGCSCFVNDPNRLYRNDGGILTPSAVWSSVEADPTHSVAWGDYDGDGDLDLAVGNNAYWDTSCSCWVSRPNRLYRNDGDILTPSAVWSSLESDWTSSVAWGDYDGDGDLDLAVGNDGQPNRLYRNDRGILSASAVWSSVEADKTQSVAWGDYDGDGDLDLAVGNYGQPNRLYRNDEGTLTTSAVWSSVEADNASSVAWGDYDGDGDLDLAVGNFSQPTRLYRNDNGVLTTSAVWSSVEADAAFSVAWGDYDSDGDLDLIVASYPQVRLYRNDGGTLTVSAVWSSARTNAYSIAWGDVDGDGDIDLAVGNNQQSNQLYRNTRDRYSSLGSVPLVRVARPGPNGDFFSSPKIWTDLIPITYTLSDLQGDPVKFIRAWYSPDGGGKWYTATAASDTATTNLSTSGNALKFDGVDDYVEVPHSASLNITDSLTLEAWVNLTNPYNDQKIVGKSPMGSGYLLGVIWNQLYLDNVRLDKRSNLA